MIDRNTAHDLAEQTQELPLKMVTAVAICLAEIEAAAKDGKWSYRPFDQGALAALTESQKVELFDRLSKEPHMFLCDIDKGEIRW